MISSDSFECDSNLFKLEMSFKCHKHFNSFSPFKITHHYYLLSSLWMPKNGMPIPILNCFQEILFWAFSPKSEIASLGYQLEYLLCVWKQIFKVYSKHRFLNKGIEQCPLIFLNYLFITAEHGQETQCLQVHIYTMFMYTPNIFQTQYA